MGDAGTAAVGGRLGGAARRRHDPHERPAAERGADRARARRPVWSTIGDRDAANDEPRPPSAPAVALSAPRPNPTRSRARIDYELPADGRIELRGSSGTALAQRVATFAHVSAGELAVVIDSWGWAAVVVNLGSAADLLGLAPGDGIELRVDPGRST